MVIENLSDKELRKLYNEYHNAVHVSECYSARDVFVLNQLSNEIVKREYLKDEQEDLANV